MLFQMMIYWVDKVDKHILILSIGKIFVNPSDKHKGWLIKITKYVDKRFQKASSDIHIVHHLIVKCSGWTQCRLPGCLQDVFVCVCRVQACH